MISPVLRNSKLVKFVSNLLQVAYEKANRMFAIGVLAPMILTTFIMLYIWTQVMHLVPCPIDSRAVFLCLNVVFTTSKILSDRFGPYPLLTVLIIFFSSSTFWIVARYRLNTTKYVFKWPKKASKSA